MGSRGGYRHGKRSSQEPVAWYVTMPGGDAGLFWEKEEAKTEADKWWRGEIKPLYANPTDTGSVT